MPFRRLFELRAEEGVAGTHKFEQGGYPSSIAETEAGHWFLHGSRLLIPRLSIWTSKRQYIAAFEGSRAGQGSLQFTDGQTYRWDYKDFLRTVWVFLNVVEKPILCFKPGYGRTRIRGKLDIHPPAFNL